MTKSNPDVWRSRNTVSRLAVQTVSDDQRPGLYMPGINQCLIKTPIKTQTRMTTIANVEGKNHISYKIAGTAADYTAHLQAVAAAVASPTLNDEERQTLGCLLKEMLPTEDQLNIEGK